MLTLHCQLTNALIPVSILTITYDPLGAHWDSAPAVGEEPSQGSGNLELTQTRGGLDHC